MARSQPPVLEWQSFLHKLPDGTRREGHRSAVPGGWVVLLPSELGGGIFFYEDPAHRWTGNAAPPAAGTRPLPRARPASKAQLTLAWEPFLQAIPGSAAREGFRSAVPGGWFVMLAFRPGGGVFYYRDPPHQWGADELEALSGGATMMGSGSFARAAILVEWKPFRHALPDRGNQEAFRAKVPGGWFVLFPLELGGGVTFYEDPTGAWAGALRDG